MLGLFLVAGLRERASNGVKSKANESMKPVTVIFDIVVDSLLRCTAGRRCAKRNFSHALPAEVKTIF